MLTTLLCSGGALSDCTLSDATLIFVIGIPLLLLLIWITEG